MRIVYDDAKAARAVISLEQFMVWQLNPKEVVREENGMLRVQRPELKRQLAHYLARDGFQIGDRATHAYGIGNNCNYPVFYMAREELQQCCSINLNIDPFGVGYVSLEDYNGKRISDLYKVSSKRVIIERRRENVL